MMLIERKSFIGNKQIEPTGLKMEIKTKKFHVTTKQSRVKNRITSLLDLDGN